MIWKQTTHLGSRRSESSSSPALGCFAYCILDLLRHPGRVSSAWHDETSPLALFLPYAAGKGVDPGVLGSAALPGRLGFRAGNLVAKAVGCVALCAGMSCLESAGSSRDDDVAVGALPSCSCRWSLAMWRCRGSAWSCRCWSRAVRDCCAIGSWWGHHCSRWACGRPAAVEVEVRCEALCPSLAAAAEILWSRSPFLQRSCPVLWKRCWLQAARWTPRWSLEGPGWLGWSRAPPSRVPSWSAVAWGSWCWACRGLCGGEWCWEGWRWC